MRCPKCGGELTADTEVFTTYRKSVHEGVEIIGCEYCIRSTYADEFFDEEELYAREKAQDNHINNLWDMSQEMKALMNYKAGVGNE